MSSVVAPDDPITAAWQSAQGGEDPISTAWTAAQKKKKFTPVGPPAPSPTDLAAIRRAAPSESTQPGAPARGIPEDSPFGTRLLSAVGQMASDPMRTAIGMAAAPVGAFKTGAEKIGQTAAEMTLPPQVATRAFMAPDRVSDFDAALAAAQLAATMPSLLSGARGMVASRLAKPIGSTAATVIGTGAAGALPGAAYNPQDPAVGATLGFGFGAAGGAIERMGRPRPAPPTDVPPSYEFDVLPRRPAPTATAVAVEEAPPPSAPQAETIDQTFARMWGERGAPPSRQLAAGPRSLAASGEPIVDPFIDEMYKPLSDEEFLRAFGHPRTPRPVETPEAPPQVVPMGEHLAELDRRAAAARGLEPGQVERRQPPAAAPVPEPAAATPKVIPGLVGKETRVLLPSGESIPAQYKISEANDLIPSHSPFTFQPNTGFPEGVQGRDYQRNVGAQQTTRLRALSMDPNMMLNPSESIGEGPPTTHPEGWAASGTGRLMLRQLSSEIAPQKSAAYVEELKRRATSYGIAPEDIAKIDQMQNPTLHRELTAPADIQGGPARWAAINQASDESAMKAKSAIEEGGARSTKLAGAPEALAHFTETIQPDETISDYLEGAAGKKFVSKLQDEGVFTPEEFGRLSDGKGGLTEDGRLAVRRMMLGAAIPDMAAISESPSSVLQKIEHAVPAIVATRGSSYDVADKVAKALKILTEAKNQGVTLRDLKDQVTMFGEKQDKIAHQLAEFINSHKKAEVSTAFRQYGTLAREAISNAQNKDMFGGTGYTPETAFAKAFGIEPEKVGPGVQMEGRGGRRAMRPPSSPTYGEGEVVPGGPQGMTAAKQRAERVVSDPAEQAWARAGKPTLAYREARGLLGMSGKIGGEELSVRQPDIASTEAGPTRYARGQQEMFAPEPKKSAPVEPEPPKKSKPPEQGVLFDRTGAARRSRPTERAEPRSAPAAEPAEGEPSTEPTARRETPLPRPTGMQVFKGFRPTAVGDAIKSALNPELIDWTGPGAAGTIAEQYARGYRATAIAKEVLRGAKEELDKLPREELVRIISASERGESLGDPGLDQFDRLYRSQLEKRTNMLVSLGRLSEEHVVDNYVGRYWSQNDDKKKASFLAWIRERRTLEGSKSFLMPRTLEHFTDGIERGLIPPTYNYIEMALGKLEEMDNLIAGALSKIAERRRGRIKPIFYNDEGQEIPPSDEVGQPWVRVGHADDPAFTVFGDNTEYHTEYFDQQQRQGINEAIARLNKISPLTHTRGMGAIPIAGEKLPRTAWGAASPKGDEMVTRFGGPNATILHELGHILDFRYKLWDVLTDPGPPKETVELKSGKRKGQTVARTVRQEKDIVEHRKMVEQELRDLADARWKDDPRAPAKEQEGKAGFVKYARNKFEKIANAVDALTGAPELMRQLAPTIMDRLTEFLKSKPELAPILDIKPGVKRTTGTVSVKRAGKQILGHYYAPRGAAAVWNNHLSKGLAGKPLYDAFMAPIRAAQQMLLGFSGFHAMNIASEGIFSELGLGIDQLTQGKSLEGMKDVMKAGAAPVRMARLGQKVMSEYLQPGAHPELAPVLEAMIKGGFRGTYTSEMWTGERKERLKNALRTALDENAPALERAWGAARVPFNSIWAGVEWGSSFVMAKYVPLMKTGAIFMATSRALAKLDEKATYEQVHRLMRDINKEYQYRFGQVDYDNFFINRTAKNIAQMLLLAPGWTFGTMTLMGRAATDFARLPARLGRAARGEGAPPLLTGEGKETDWVPPKEPGGKPEPAPRLPENTLGATGAYMIGSFVAFMVMNAMLTQILAGDKSDNWTWKDFFGFRDGTYDQYGNPNRHFLPGYIMADYYGWTHHPITTATNKMSPMIAFVWRMKENKDYWGNKIYNEDDSAAEKIKQVARSVITQFRPLSLSNFAESQRRGETGVGSFMQNFMGIKPAKKEFQQTPAQTMISRYLGERIPGGKTPEEVDLAARRREAIQQARSGNPYLLQKMRENREITRQAAHQQLTRAGKDQLALRFKSLTLPQMDNVMKGELTDDERRIFTPLWKHKQARSGRP